MADPGGLQDSTDVLIEVLNVNRPPELPHLSGHGVGIGSSFRLIVPGGDPDAGTTLTYSAKNLPAGATLNGTTGELVWTAGGGSGG